MSNTEKNFSKYGKNFQEKVFQSMLSDRTWAAQMIEVMDPSFFDVKYLGFLCESYFAYYEKYKCIGKLSFWVVAKKFEFDSE